MAQQSEPLHNDVIREFQATLQDCTVPAACGRSYVRTTKLKDWLRGNVKPNSPTTQASRLLAAAYHRRRHPSLPISSEELSSGENCCLLVFSILLELRLGQLVDRFQRQSIVDRRLPIDLRALQTELAAMDLGTMKLPNVENLAEKFDNMQWRFCPARFDLRVGWDHPKNKIIPIFKKEKINDKGGTAQLWQVAVQEEFVGDKIRKAVRNSRFHDATNGFGYVSSTPHSATLFRNIASASSPDGALGYLGLPLCFENIRRGKSGYLHQRKGSFPWSPRSRRDGPLSCRLRTQRGASRFESF
jgi:hypothetical protein